MQASVSAKNAGVDIDETASWKETEPTEIAGVGDDKESVDDDNIESEQDEV